MICIRSVAPTLVLCFSPIIKYSGLEKLKIKEENIINKFFPESVESMTLEEFENDIYFQYSKDFEIRIKMKKVDNKKKNPEPTFFTLKEGLNSGNDKIKISLTLEKIKTLESGLCYKLTSDVETFEKINYFSLELKEHFKGLHIESKFDRCCQSEYFHAS